MAEIVRSSDMSDVVDNVTTRMLNMIGPDHPKMTQKDRDIKAAQRHIVLLYADVLGDTWVLPADVQVKNAVIM